MTSSYYLAIEKIMLTDPKQKEKESKWFFSQKQLENDTPSRKRGMSYEDELNQRRLGIRFLKQLTTVVYSNNSSMYKKTYVVVNSTRVFATAAVWFHRFYMVHPIQIFDVIETAMACFYLSSKAEDYPENINSVISKTREILKSWRIPFIASNLEAMETIKDLESCIMKTIGFVCWVRHPQQFVQFFMDQFITGDKDKMAKIQQLAASYATDSLCFPFCVRENPKKMAIAFILWACQEEKYELNNWTHKDLINNNLLDVFKLKQQEIDNLYKEFCEYKKLNDAEHQEFEAKFNNNPDLNYKRELSKIYEP